MSRSHFSIFVLWLFSLTHVGYGQDAAPTPAVTLENVQAPTSNTPDEPMALAFSVAKATEFLDSAALQWQKQRKCFTCHTNYAYLMARPSISADVQAHREVRAFAEELVTERWQKEGPRWNAEVVATGAFLAMNDGATTGKLHPVTRQALDRMWTLQRADGGWDWLKCDWPPMESDDHYGATLAALGVGLAPEGYAQTEAAQAGLTKLRAYFKTNPAPTLHHSAMLLWASKHVPDLMDPADIQACVDSLAALQRPDGGWALASLGNWVRDDKSPQDITTSDGYGTGFVTYVLRQAGIPADDERLKRAAAWLKGHQRASGRWFTRSLHADSQHFISHAGTAFALMALAACNALQDDKPVAKMQFEVPNYCEGVVFDQDGFGYVSEGSSIWKFAIDGPARTWGQSEAPNGHKVLPDGRHLVCDGKARAVLRFNDDGNLLDSIIDTFDGRPLLGPNDLSLDPVNGGFYFSDPGESSKENPIGAVYYSDLAGVARQIDTGLAYPNGIVLSADGKRLYLAESQLNRILVYDVEGPGKTGPRKVFAELPAKDPNLGQIDNQPDGMCLDDAGNLYVAHYGMQRVQVLDPQGVLIASLPGGNLTTSNVAFGGPDRKQLYVTGGLAAYPSKGGVFRLEMSVAGLDIVPPKKAAEAAKAE